MNYKSVLLSILVVALWGLNPAVSKLGMTDIPPFTFLMIRYLLTAVIFIPFSKLNKSDIKLLLVIALLSNVINNGLSYIGFEYLTPTASALLLQLEAPITIFIAYLWGKENFSYTQVMGLVMAILGTMVVLGLPDIHIIGAILIISTRIFWGFAQLLFKQTKEIDGATFIGYTSLFAVPFMFGFSFIFREETYAGILSAFSFKQGIIMVFQVILLSMAMIWWQKLIVKHGVNKISPYSVLQIVFGIIGGIIFFDDVINFKVIVGVVLISLGVIFSTTEFKPKLKFWDK